MNVGDLVLRPASLDDAAFAADVDTEVEPDEPRDPLMARHWWEMVDAESVVGRWIATLAGDPVGYARWHHLPWERMPERFMRVAAELRPVARTEERLSALHDLLESAARDEGALRVTTVAREDDPPRLRMLDRRGYREERRQRTWELDLVAHGDRIAAMAAASREQMAREGIRVLTLDRDDDPERWEKLKRMSDEAEADVPTSVPHVAMEMAAWMRWYESPAIRLDRVWIARAGDDIVGVSQLSYPPVRGVVSTDWTGTARAVRGRGVARALKCETLAQAIALGVDRVRTDNDSANAPILHINETMGYRRRPDAILFVKEAA